jgi:DNA primase
MTERERERKKMKNTSTKPKSDWLPRHFKSQLKLFLKTSQQQKQTDKETHVIKMFDIKTRNIYSKINKGQQRFYYVASTNCTSKDHVNSTRKPSTKKGQKNNNNKNNKLKKKKKKIPLKPSAHNPQTVGGGFPFMHGPVSSKGSMSRRL